MGDLEGLLAVSVGQLAVVDNNPAMETRPMGSMERKKAEEQLKTQLRKQLNRRLTKTQYATTT